MLRIIQRWIGRIRPTAASEPAPNTTVLLVRVPSYRSFSLPRVVDETLPPPPERSATLGPSERSGDWNTPAECMTPAGQATQPATRAGGVALSRLAIFSPRVLQKLRRAGFHSCRDLLAADPDRVVKRIGAPQRWTVKIRRCQRAIRFSRGFSEMTPHEALLLFAAHRRSRVRLAAESPGVLKRDLERLLLSSRGQKLACGRPVPEIGRVRLWIQEARRAQTERLNYTRTVPP